jgi:hypothetical protein
MTAKEVRLLPIGALLRYHGKRKLAFYLVENIDERNSRMTLSICNGKDLSFAFHDPPESNYVSELWWRDVRRVA